jgi:hypothetical protein
MTCLPGNFGRPFLFLPAHVEKQELEAGARLVELKQGFLSVTGVIASGGLNFDADLQAKAARTENSVQTAGYFR